MVKYTRITAANHSTYADKRRRAIQESMLEYSEHVRQISTTRDKYGHYDSPKQKFSRDTRAQNGLTNSDNFERLHDHHHLYPKYLESHLPCKEIKHYPKTNRHIEFDKLRHRYIPEYDIDNLMNIDFEQRNMLDSHFHVKVNCVSTSDSHKLAHPGRKKKVVKAESYKLLNQENGAAYIQQVDSRSYKEDGLEPFRYGRLKDITKMHNSLTEKQNINGRALEVFDVEGNSKELISRRIKNISATKEKYQLFTTLDDHSGDDLRDFVSRDSLTSYGDVTTMDDIKKSDISHPDILTMQSEVQCLNSVHTPIRLLQRPTRVKRMDLHEPELTVIPEVGGSFVHSENMDTARKDMLTPKPLLSRSFLYVNKDRTEKEERRNNGDTRHFQHK